MSWKATFDKGVACFKCGNLEEALIHMNEAAELESSAFIIYDSRAAVHEKLGNIKAALHDSKCVIDLAPDRWQGYARSARLFDLLKKHDSTIKMVDHAVSRLRTEDVQRRAQLVELRERAVVAQATTRKQRSQWASYLLGKLPMETLVEIFMSLIDEDHIWAIRLSHICGHWRQVLLNAPSAWRTLVLTKKRPLRKAKLWKERAKNRIARLSIAVPQLDRPSVFAELRELSWDGLSSLCIPEDAFVELYTILCELSMQDTVSNLHELTLLDCKPYDPLPCCHSGPSWKLTSLRLSGSIYLVDDWWQRIGQLKELHLSGTVSRFSIQLFAANPSLERLVLDFPEIRDASGNDDAPTLMNSLKTIECREMMNPFELMCGITTPSIMHFTMTGVGATANETLLHIASHPSLVELHVAYCSLDLVTLPNLLSSTPNLETLRVNGVYTVVNEMFRFLTPKTVDPPHSLPCRALKHVDVSHCSDLTTSSVYAFIKSRMHYTSESVESAMRCAAVVSLKVDGCPNIEPDMLPWFRSKVERFSCVYATKRNFRKRPRMLIDM